MKKIKQICVKTRENIKVPSSQKASPKLQTERSGDLVKGRSLERCRAQASGDCHALPRTSHTRHLRYQSGLISPKPGDTTC